MRSIEDSTIAATSSNNCIKSTVTESSDAMQSTSSHQGQFSYISMGSTAENSHHLFSTELSQSVMKRVSQGRILMMTLQISARLV